MLKTILLSYLLVVCTACRNKSDFIALLYNSRRAVKSYCTGAILTTYWILDNCPTKEGLKNDYAKAGWLNPVPNNYKIAKTVIHENYKKVHFSIHDYDTRHVYGVSNAVILHKTATQMCPREDTIRPIPIYQSGVPPKQADVIYFNEGKLECKKLDITAPSLCNKRFEEYFNKRNRLLLNNNSDLCVNTAGINPRECVNGRALMVHNNDLVGVMGWSTICSEEVGVNPWVFSFTAYYRQWIAKNVNWFQNDDDELCA